MAKYPAPNIAAAAVEYVDEVAATAASTPESSPAPLPTSGGEVWQPLRIAVFAKDLNNTALYCAAAGQYRLDYLGNLVNCSDADVLTDAKREILLEVLVPTAVRLHAERLLVRPLARITPRNPLAAVSEAVCARFDIPFSHFRDGVADADFLLYVASAPAADGEGAMAWARTCQVDARTGRPVMGVLNVSPRYLVNTSAMARVLAHEMLHALGFDTAVFTQKNMVSRTPLRGKLSVVGVRSAATLAAAREHYACPSARLMELEDADEGGAVGSHWKMRNAVGELMASGGGPGPYSAMTMGAMQDTGFYRGNFSMAEPLLWGQASGCALLTSKCLINGVQQAESPMNRTRMFCNASTDEGACTLDRLSVGACDIYNSTQPFAFYSQYFTFPYTGGSLAQMDYCPYVHATDTALSCSGGSLAAMPASVVSPTARCLSAPAGSSGVTLWIGSELPGAVTTPVQRGAMCVEVACHSESRSYQVRVRGAQHFVDCAVGSTIEPSKSNPYRFGGGALVCPSYEEVCAGHRGVGSLRTDPVDGCHPSPGASLHLAAVVFALGVAMALVIFSPSTTL